MSEFLAEARIVVRPDTSRFRSDLEAQLKSVLARPVKIPVIPVVAPAFAAAAAGVTAFTVAQQAAAGATAVSADALAAATTITRNYAGVVDLAAVSSVNLAAAQEKEAVSATRAAAAEAAHARSLNQTVRGAAASGLTLFGLRGATLAASGAFLAGTAAVVGFSRAVQSAAALETELNVFRVTAGATADEMVRVSANARQLGRDITLPGVTASTAATAMTELAKAGLSVRDSIDGARGTLQLATAAQIDVKASTELVAGALNSFELAGRDAVKVADLLAGAAKESQGDISDMATALSQAAAVSKQFGVSIEDTVTLLTQLAQAGLAGGRAGTSLRVAFLRLVNPPADAAKALKELNVQIRDAEGNLRPQIFTDIQKSLQGYSKAQQDATLATIFGSDAIRTAAIIGNKGAAAYKETAAAVTEAGLAQEAAAARTSGLAGDIENLSNQASSLGLTVGNVAKGPLSAFVKVVAEQVATVNDALTGLVALGSEFKDLGSAVKDSIPFVDSFGVGLDDIASASVKFGPVLAPFTALAGVAKTFGLNVEEAGGQAEVFGDIIDAVKESVDGLTSALSQAAADLKTTLPTDTGLNVRNIENIIGGFDAEEVRARIAGDNAQLVDVLETEQAFLERQLERQYVKNRPALKRAIEQALLGVVTDLRGIQATSAAQSERLKREAARIAEKRAKAIADAAKALRDKIEAAAKKAADLAKEQQRLQEQRRQDFLRGLDLDIGLAEITDNQAAEVKARNRKLTVLEKALKEEARLHGKNTLAYKEIRNEIAAERAAIEEIRKEKQKSNSAFGQASFEFLQAQQGFASSLLGNLIPRGATGGLVAGASGPVQSALTPVAGAAEARSTGGPTAGQGNTTNAILQRILEQLKMLNGGQVAPEAIRQWRSGHASMDGVGGG